jgi:hypothetical protein
MHMQTVPWMDVSVKIGRRSLLPQMRIRDDWSFSFPTPAFLVPVICLCSEGVPLVRGVDAVAIFAYADHPRDG